MKCTTSDLNMHLFAQLERLGDEDLAGDKLLEEIGRSKAITGVAVSIIDNGNLMIKAAELVRDYNGRSNLTLPNFLGEVDATPV